MTTIPIEHPSWCALTTCTAGQPGGAHRSRPVVFRAPAVAVELALHQSMPGEVFLTVVVSDPMGGGDGFAFTLALPDAWRLTDTVTSVLEQAR